MQSYIEQLSELLQRARAGDHRQRVRLAFKQLKKSIHHEIGQGDDQGDADDLEEQNLGKFPDVKQHLLDAIDCGLAYMQNDQQPLEPAWVLVERAEDILEASLILNQAPQYLIQRQVYAVSRLAS
jgi:hypothetical protein